MTDRWPSTTTAGFQPALLPTGSMMLACEIPGIQTPVRRQTSPMALHSTATDVVAALEPLLPATLQISAAEDVVAIYSSAPNS